MQWIFLRHLRTLFCTTIEEQEMNENFKRNTMYIHLTCMRDGCTDAVEASYEQQLRAFHIKDVRKEIT